MTEIEKCILGVESINKGDIYYLPRYNYFTGEDCKIRPHIVIDVVDGYWGGVLMMAISSHAKHGYIPIITNPQRHYMSYAVTNDIIVVPLQVFKETVKSNSYLYTMDSKLCDSLKLIHMITTLGYKPTTNSDQMLLSYMTDYVNSYNQIKDKYTTLNGDKLQFLKVATLEYQ